MYVLTVIGIGLAVSLVSLILGKLGIGMYGKGTISYKSGIVIAWLSTFVYYMAIVVCGALIAFHFVTWLGIVVGVVLLIGMFGDRRRTIIGSARHSLKLATERNHGKQE